MSHVVGNVDYIKNKTAHVSTSQNFALLLLHEVYLTAVSKLIYSFYFWICDGFIFI